MVRRGWQQLDVPTGWVQILRGPRPKAEKWPAATKKGQETPSNGGGRWRRSSQPESGSSATTSRVRSLEAALKVLGPEEHVVREGLEASLQRAKAEAQKPSGQQRISQTPESLVAAAREKVCKLERVMEVLQGTTGAEVDAIKTALDRARVAAQEKPLTEQIAECKGFVERAQRRLSKLEAERDAENALLEEGRARLARLQAQAATHTTAPPPPPVTTNVSELEAEVSRLRAELAARANPSRDSRPEGPVLKRQCRREEFVPQCDEEMEEWLAGRHADLQTALATGQLLEVARLSQLMTTAAEEWHQLIQNQRTAPSALANTVR